MQSKKNIGDRVPGEAKFVLCITMIGLALMAFVVVQL